MLDINLTELQKTLDSQGLEVVENQKESVVGRKSLADKTKGKLSVLLLLRNMCSHSRTDFKKIPDEEKVNAFKGLLKCASHLSLVLASAHPLFYHSVSNRDRQPHQTL